MTTSHILVVDDDDTLLSIVDSILQKNGFCTSLSSSAEECFDLIDKFTQLILLDVRMPQMSGYDALIKLKSDNETKDIPVIMLTSENDISSVSNSLEAGACDYIVKPFDHNNLILRIKKVISGL